MIITAQSSPVYNTSLFGSDASAWVCADWINWYTQLRKVYTSDQADYLWSKAWLDGVSKVSGGNGTAPGSGYITDSSPLDCRTFDAAFKSFLSSHANLKSAVYSGIGGLIAKPIGFGVDVFNGVVTVGENLLGAVTGTSTVLKYAIPAVVVVLLIFLLIFAFKFTGAKTKQLT